MIHAHAGLQTNNAGAFVLLSYAVAVLAGWTAIDLFQRIRGREGPDQTPWLATASLAMGGGIWAMHFIAMLGYHPAQPIDYDPLMTLASFLLAVAGTAAAFFAASRERLGAGRIPLAGVVMGLAIALMHYVGMAAMQMTGRITWRYDLVVLSVLIAITASMAALWTARREVSLPARAASAAILGLAVTGMHYVGMAAFSVETLARPATVTGIPPIAIAVAVAAVTAIILCVALAAAMADERDRLVEVLAAGDVGYWEVYVRTRAFTLSPRARELLGMTGGQSAGSVLGPTWLAPDQYDRRAEALEKALTGEAEYDVEYPVEATGRWVQSRGRLVRSRSGRPIKLAGVVTDITDRHRAFEDLETSERRQKLLINELNHRVKNTLATLQSIAALTARRATSVEEFSAQFGARLMALSDTHNLLTSSGWEQATLADLLANELRPFAPEQFRLEGPDLMLGAPQALAMGMIFHELATNAAKHGALSTPDGCVSVAWSAADAEGRTTLEWNETGGPAVRQPSRTGFGSRLIATSLKGDLGGSAELDYEPQGFKALLAFRPQAATGLKDPDGEIPARTGR